MAASNGTRAVKPWEDDTGSPLDLSTLRVQRHMEQCQRMRFTEPVPFLTLDYHVLNWFIQDQATRLIQAKEAAYQSMYQLERRLGSQSQKNILKFTQLTEELYSRYMKLAADFNNLQNSSFNLMSERITKLENELGLQIRNTQIEDQKTYLNNFLKTSFNGCLRWKIDEVSRRRNESHIKHSFYSHPFFTETYGYKMCARIYFNGDGNGKNTHVSMFFVVMKGEYDALLPWPFQQQVTMKLWNQTKRKPDIIEKLRPERSSSSFQRPKNEMNIASGCPQFAEQSVVFGENNGYVVNDTMFIEIRVDPALNKAEAEGYQGIRSVWRWILTVPKWIINWFKGPSASTQLPGSMQYDVNGKGLVAISDNILAESPDMEKVQGSHLKETENHEMLIKDLERMRTSDESARQSMVQHFEEELEKKANQDQLDHVAVAVAENKKNMSRENTKLKTRVQALEQILPPNQPPPPYSPTLPAMESEELPQDEPPERSDLSSDESDDLC